MTRLEARRLFNEGKLAQDTICTCCHKRYSTHSFIPENTEKLNDILYCKDQNNMTQDNMFFSLEGEEEVVYRKISSLLVTASSILLINNKTN